MNSDDQGPAEFPEQDPSMSSDEASPANFGARALRALGWTGIVLLVACALFDLYARWPSSARLVPLVLPEGTREVVLIFHGTGGVEEPTLLALGDRFAEFTRDRPQTQVVYHRWSPFSDNMFRASANADRLGVQVGEELADHAGLQRIHLIATSAGSYLLEPLCRRYREASGAPARVEMTYLDPIGIRGAWDWGHGYRNHGDCADYAEAYINTDDEVPGTNAALRRAANIDVTSVPAREGFQGSGHLWPVRYYLDALSREQTRPGRRDHAQHARGSVSLP